MKVHIATDRPVGYRCKDWAETQLDLVSAEESEIYISVLSTKLIDEDFIKDRYCFNFHPGILPQYRGSGLTSWVLINEEKIHGITLHEMDKGIDTGPIIDIWRFIIRDNDTAGSLFQRVERFIEAMFRYWFHSLLVLKYDSHEQTECYPLYQKKDLEKVKDLTRYYRAFQFPGKEGAYYYKDGCKTYLGGEDETSPG